jgi:hypothetical protein
MSKISNSLVERFFKIFCFSAFQGKCLLPLWPRSALSRGVQGEAVGANHGALSTSTWGPVPASQDMVENAGKNSSESA